MTDVSLQKAQTAASFGLQPKTLKDQIKQDRTGFLKLPDALLLVGGIPIIEKASRLARSGMLEVSRRTTTLRLRPALWR
jgi:uncharacterized protein GlcG (DUF336 family)